MCETSTQSFGGLVNKTQRAVISAGMPEHGRFWEFPLIFHPPHLLRLLSLHKNSNVVSHLRLTQTACPSPQIKQSRVSQEAPEVILKQSIPDFADPADHKLIFSLNICLQAMNLLPLPSSLLSFSSSGLCPRGSDEDTSFSPGNWGIYTSQK